MTSNHSNLIIYTLTFKTYDSTFFLSLMEYAAFPFLNTLLEVFYDDEQQGGDTRRQTPFGNIKEGSIMRKGNSHNSTYGLDREV